jgi:hypothetical protein
MSMSMKRNFGISSGGMALAAATATQATLIDPPGLFPDVMIYNPGPYVVRVRVGLVGVTADATCMPILVGEKSSYFKGANTHIAYISPSGNQAIEVFDGEGE